MPNWKIDVTSGPRNISHEMRAVVLSAWLAGMLSLCAKGQAVLAGPGAAPSSPPSAEAPAQGKLPNADLPNSPGAQAAEDTPTASITGTVMDPSGATVPGARVALQMNSSNTQRTALTSSDGSFDFATLEPGSFAITIRSQGFAAWTSNNIALSPGETYELPQVTLRVATAMDVEVYSSPHELAEEQVHAQEKQRVLGIIPNFYTTYVWNAAPLTAKQKFGLAIRSEIDPISFVGAAVGAGYEQWENDFNGYDQGAQGFAKRFGASYVTGFNGAIIGGGILPAILHQDPRYFWMGTGTIRHRALYSVSTVVICRGDNGKWETNYSNIFGNLAAGGLSNLYYPQANRGAALTINNSLLGFASQAIGNLFQEFIIRKISTGAKP